MTDEPSNVLLKISDPVEILPDTEASRDLLRRRQALLDEVQAREAQIKRAKERVCYQVDRSSRYISGRS